ncbi:MAG: hypothetical protein HYY76_17845 [Acidobacteria bacterium]|nr:hypothetical protein [Acidobacteriota bacterium]
MKGFSLVAVIIVVAALGAPARAHHSFAATYDQSRTVTIEGKLVQFLYRNPHSFVHVLARDDKGQEQRWAAEWGGAGQLQGQGITRETLQPGDVVVITGNPARSPGEYRIRMLTLRRPSDGFGWGTREGETVD